MKLVFVYESRTHYLLFHRLNTCLIYTFLFILQHLNSIFFLFNINSFFAFGKTVLRAVEKEMSIIALAGMEMEYIDWGLRFSVSFLTIDVKCNRTLSTLWNDLMIRFRSWSVAAMPAAKTKKSLHIYSYGFGNFFSQHSLEIIRRRRR